MPAKVKLYSIAGLTQRGQYVLTFVVVKRGITKMIDRRFSGAQINALHRFWDKDNKRFYSGSKLANGLTWDTLPRIKRG